MDVKFIIIVVALIALALFLMGEINNLRKEIVDEFSKLENILEKHVETIRLKIQTDNFSSINKIKLYNEDLIHQIRRINMIEALPMTNMSNHYTDGDSECEGKLPYLSDVKRNDNNRVEEFVPYASDSDESVNEKQDLFKIIYESSNTPSIETTQCKTIERNLFSSLKEHKTAPPAEPSSEPVEKSAAEPPAAEPSAESVANNLETKLQVVSPSASSSLIDVNNECLQINDSSSTETTQDRESKHSTTSEGTSIPLRDNITIGSHLGKKGTKPMISTSRNDDASVASTNVVLGPIESYNVDQLKNLAKQKSIPLTHVINGSRKQLKKEELYSKLQNVMTVDQ